MSAKVYLVTSGSYSDYRVNAVFSTARLAKAAIAARIEKMNQARRAEGVAEVHVPDRWDADWGDYQIEEYSLDGEWLTPQGAFLVTIDDAGTVTDAIWGEELKPDQSPYFVPSLLMEKNAGTIVRLPERRFMGLGETIEHARRSAEELRRQTIVLQGAKP